MKYPNNIKKNTIKFKSYSNRGMVLESIINDANSYYLEQSIAIIYKKPTPIGIVKSCGSKITDAYFKEQSTLDYNGIYNGKYIEFDAKETMNKTSYSLSNIHMHQLEHIKNIITHGGIAFIILSMNNKYFILNGITILDFIQNYTRKSIPYEYICENSIEIYYNYNKGLDYIIGIDKLMEDYK